jgi:hypothetical protein
MAGKGHEERFPPTRLSAGFGFRKETNAGVGESANRRSREKMRVTPEHSASAGVRKIRLRLALHLTIYSWREQGADLRP